MADIRDRQSKRYGDVTEEIHELTLQNMAKMAEVRALLMTELSVEENEPGALHLDPIAIRLRSAHDMLSHALVMADEVRDGIVEKEQLQAPAAHPNRLRV